MAAAISLSPEAGIAIEYFRLYAAALGADPSSAVIGSAVAQLESGLTAAQISAGAVAQPAWSQIAGSLVAKTAVTNIYQTATDGTIPGATAAAVIDALYVNILGRHPAASELAFYQGQISQGAGMATLLQEFSNSPEYQHEVDGAIAASLASGAIGGPNVIRVATPISEEIVTLPGTVNTGVTIIGIPGGRSGSITLLSPHSA
jgi:hypothetical protein